MNEVAEIEKQEIDKLSIRNDILDFEQVLMSQPDVIIGDSTNCPLTHSFSPDLYVREIFIPANTVLTGKIHKHSHPNFLIQGEVVVVTEVGGIEHLKAPVSMISASGTKRVVHAITDCRWITVHLNKSNTQDLKKLEEEIIAPSYEAYDRFKKLENSYCGKITTFVRKLIR